MLKIKQIFFEFFPKKDFLNFSFTFSFLSDKITFFVKKNRGNYAKYEVTNRAVKKRVILNLT